MFLTYLWQSSGLTHKEAHDRFSSVLLKQGRLYNDAFGREPVVKIKQLRSILIGQLQYDSGIAGWESWVDMGEAGVVWDGVCENYLGKKMDNKEIGDVLKILRYSPRELLSWNGMFSVIAWDESGDNVSLTTAATESPTLMYTEGPFGWASGPRAAPLLEMVGNRATPNIGAMELYLLYGYFLGGHSPFQRISRIHDRQQIIIEQHSRPGFSTYVSLTEYLDAGQKISNWNEAVSFGADRITQRVNTQIKHSLDPVVLLTGGRDSRSIAAAAKKTGRHFITTTSGKPDSYDVTIAAEVSKVLGAEHRFNYDTVVPGLLCDSRERLKLWAQLSEGLIPFNFCLHMRDFFAGNLPFPVVRAPVFHGHEPNIGRCVYFSKFELDKLMSMSLQDAHASMTQKNHFLKKDMSANNLLQEIFSNVDKLLLETGGKVYEWLELFFWRERMLWWGFDLQSVYGPIRWAWTPLFDRELMILCRNLTLEQKKSANFLIDVATSLEPALAEVKCTPAYPVYTGVRRLVNRIGQRIIAEMRNCNRVDKADEALTNFWEMVYMSRTTHIWREFIDEADLRKIIRISPQNALLWRLITIDLLAQIYF